MSTTPRYSRLERLTHRIAFSNPAVQLTAADVEAAVFSSKFKNLPVERPVFVTSLPRAGTTLLLEVLAHSPELATHTYRDMPFVLAPILWDRLSRPFRKKNQLRERAHGDGMAIGYDSPEAFEEVVWKAFWPKWFRGKTLPLWPADAQAPGFEAFLRNHMKKVAAVRRFHSSQPTRYLSKNNGNMARLGLLKRLFPDGTILVPFRNPLDQAESLRRQHLRFKEIHGSDGFARQYMKDLGHLEFGDLHTPFGFPGMDGIREAFTPEEPGYWLGYWLKAFGAILEEASHVTFLSYERLCAQGPAGLEVLADLLHLDPAPFVDGPGPTLRAPNGYALDESLLDPADLEESRRLHDRLLDLSLL